jgi:dethiobiotin synthetase
MHPHKQYKIYSKLLQNLTSIPVLSSDARAAAGSTKCRFFSSCGGQRPIFVAATKQHVGKTTTSLALMSGLQKRFPKVGFIKPVGQQHVTVFSEALKEEIRVDKDICLLKEQFHLDHIDYRHMSPVIIPRGYTKKYIDGEISYDGQLKDIEMAFEKVSEASDVVLIEGTGHCAVGSVVGVNNAQVASMLGASMVLIANGGLGSAFDELGEYITYECMNATLITKALFRHSLLYFLYIHECFERAEPCSM